jgi:hypothetical protein
MPAPAPDRLQQLLRQRALLQEHLAWLDREIADASSGVTGPPPAPTPLARAAQQPLVIPSPAAPPTPTILSPRPPHPVAPYVASQAAQILSTAAGAPPVESPPAVEAAAAEILEQYRVAPDSMKTDVKKGCFLYFFAALAFVAVVVVVLYFIFQRGR